MRNAAGAVVTGPERPRPPGIASPCAAGSAGCTPADRSTTAAAEERRVASALVRELEPEFAATLSNQAVSACVRQAINDLRGSVHAESLPEMAARLAHYRLMSAVEGIDNAGPAQTAPT